MMFKNLLLSAVCIIAFFSGCSRRPLTSTADSTPKPVGETPSVKPADVAVKDRGSETKVAPPAVSVPLPGSYVFSEGGSDEKLRPPLRERIGPPQSRPALDPVFDATRERLVKKLDDARSTGAATPDIFRSLWREYWISSFNEALAGAADARVKSGVLMPPELAAVKASRDKALDQIMTGSFPYAQSSAEIEAAGAMMLLGIGQGMGGGRHFPAMLWNRANELPPTKGDLVAYAVVSVAVREATGEQSALENWRPLMEAKNPVYRLLALEAARYAFPAEARSLPSESPKTSEVVGAHRLAFYREYLRETDPLIVATLLDAVSKVGRPDARQVLEEMRAQQVQLGNQELLARTDKALADVDRLISYRTAQPEK